MSSDKNKEIKNLPYEQKLAMLKKVHARSHPEAKMQLEKWEDELSRLRIAEDWLKHPNTQEVRDVLKDHLDRIVAVLVNDEALTEPDRKAHFKVKAVLLSVLAVFSQDPSQEMHSIHDQIDAEI